MSKEIIYCIPDAVLDGERIRGYIRNVVCKAFGSGIKMSSCRYKNHSITLDVSFEQEGGLDKMMLEVIYGDRIRKTIERLNYEWLKKMWKASDAIFKYSGLNRYAKSLRSTRTKMDISGARYEKTS